MKLTQEELNSLNVSVRAYYDYQRERISLDNRLGRKKNGTIKKGIPDRDDVFLLFLFKRRDEVAKIEAGLERDIKNAVIEHPLWQTFLKNVKGVGYIMAGVIVSEFNIYKAPMASNLVSFAGLAPGKDRKKKGKKSDFNSFLKSKLCGVLGPAFLKAKSVPYSGYYYDTKLRLENSDREVEEYLRAEDKKKKKYKGQTTRIVKWRDAYPGHRHDASIRKMIKYFLQDLYDAWRTIEGLPVREPYSEEKLGIKHNSEKAA